MLINCIISALGQRLTNQHFPGQRKQGLAYFQDFGLKLIKEARTLYTGDNQLEVRLKGNIFSLDSTTVDLCLEVFWWASFRQTKAAVKIHTPLDLKTSIPEFIPISKGSVHDANILDMISIQKGSYYILDKGYIDSERLFGSTKGECLFCNKSQGKPAIRAAIFASGQQGSRPCLRPECPA